MSGRRAVWVMRRPWRGACLCVSHARCMRLPRAITLDSTNCSCPVCTCRKIAARQQCARKASENSREWQKFGPSSDGGAQWICAVRRGAGGARAPSRYRARRSGRQRQRRAQADGIAHGLRARHSRGAMKKRQHRGGRAALMFNWAKVGHWSDSFGKGSEIWDSEISAFCALLPLVNPIAVWLQFGSLTAKSSLYDTVREEYEEASARFLP